MKNKIKTCPYHRKNKICYWKRPNRLEQRTCATEPCSPDTSDPDNIDLNYNALYTLIIKLISCGFRISRSCIVDKAITEYYETIG